MNKRWLIKINGEEHLYYDSEKKVYRMRLLCPRCGKSSGCHCYEKYEDYEDDKSSYLPKMCCSYICCLLLCPDDKIKMINDVANNLGINIKPLVEYTEEEAEQIMDRLSYIYDMYEDSSGEPCDI